MPNARIVLTPSMESGWGAAASWLVPILGRSEFLVIGGTRSAADEFVRALPGAGAFGAHRFTLVQLAASVGAAHMAELGLAPITRLGAEAVAARVADRLKKRKKLAYFGEVATMPGFAGALAATLTELRLAQVASRALRSRSDAESDIAALLDAYNDELEERRLGDIATLLEIAAEADEHPRLALPAVFLDVPLESASHEAFVSRLMKSAPSAIAVLVQGDDPCAAKYARVLGVESEPLREPETRALPRLRAHMFSTRRPPAGEMDESVEIFAAPGEGLEAVEIARRIHQYAAAGRKFDEIAILLRGPERYQPHLEEALRRAGVPAWFSRGAARPHPAGRAFLALLACALEGCSASRFAEYLSLGEIPALDQSGAPVEQPPEFIAPDDEFLAAFGVGAAAARESVPEEAETRASAVATPIAWERMLVDAAVIGGPERWRRRLRGLEREYRLRIDSSQLESQATREHLAEELHRLEALERFALPIIDLLSKFPEQAKWKQWLSHLDRLARLALKDPGTVLAALSELEPMSDIGPVELDEVLSVLTPRLRFLRSEPARRRYGQVFIGSVEEARGRVFDVVFLPGVAEGLFPQKHFEDPLLLDEVRRRIGNALQTRPEARDDERLLLRTAASAAKSRLIVSYPSMDLAQRRPRVPSFYALEVSRAVEGSVPSLRKFGTTTRARAAVKMAWPAPANPGDALDETEFDLAWFESMRGKPAGAAYLTSVNTHLCRSLRARYSRWERKWKAADGLVGTGTAERDILALRRLNARPYSASALQDFAACPYRFYLRGILGLREKETRTGIEQMDPLTRGALFHEAQYRFFQTVIGAEPESLDAALGIADAALDDMETKYREELAPAIPRVWQTEIEDLRNDLRAWARNWWSERTDWEPMHSELAFGLSELDDRDPHSVTQHIELEGGVCVRGSIDFVEKHRRRNSLRITDHKTGKAPQQEPACVGGGAVLQPALYGLVAETMLGVAVETGRLFFCTQRGGFRTVDIPLNGPTRMRVGRVLGLIDDAIGKGFLPPAPAREACALCDYRAVCGPYEEVRSQRKEPREVLEPLYEIRRMP